MDTFVKLALEKIVKASSKKDEELRATSKRVTDLIAAKTSTTGVPDAGDGNADKYFRPFQLACENSNAKIKATALDCIQKLIAYGYLRGSSRVLQNGRKRYLIDIVIETICACRDDPGESVQLQVIKALLTAVSSNTCEVHGESLLLSVRACYHIYLVSRNQVNRTTAKATLTQMLNIVFQRMEVFDQKLAAEAGPESVASEISPSASPDVASMPMPAPMLEDSAVAATVSPDGAALDTTTAPEEAVDSSNAVGAVDEASTSADVAAVASDVAASGTSPDPATSAAGDSTVEEGEGYGGTPASSGFRSPIHRDAFLLFRALCKLSMKADGEADDSGVSSPTVGVMGDTIALQSKVLSLELLLSVLEHSGPSFRSGSRFIDVIRQMLCESLLKNYVSPSAQVVSLSLKIFLALIRNFRVYLQREIEVFISEVFLRLLHSSHVPYDQRVSVLHVFKSLCQDPWGMLELFMNYDMATDRTDLFQKVLSILASISRSGGPADAQRPPQETAALKQLALNGIVTLVRSLSIIVDMSVGIAQPAVTSPPTRKADDDDAVAREVDDNEDLTSVSGQTTSGTSLSLVEDYDIRKRMKEELTRAAIKFKNKPKDGIAHLVKIGKCQDTPESIAAVFHELRDVLDKTAMGDYMGGEKEFNIKVLHAYVDQLDFTGMAFAQGIKHFLSGFRLPGEAQKIDRMMEKFAERYCSNNPEVFPTADTAFVLAYSVIMLNTDLHNPNIKPEKKMTKAGFISNNRGIAAGQDVPRQLLIDIFDEIESRPITLKEDDKLREQKQSEKEKATERRKREVLAKERADIVALGKDLFKSKPTEGAVGDDEAVKPYYSVSQLAPADVLQYTRPMFEVVWGPLIAVLSVAMELSEDPAVIETCLEGFKLGIHVAGSLGMATERNSMVGALCNFTALDPISGPHAQGLAHEFKPKNIESAKAVLHVVLHEGNNIGSSWGPLLHCVSQIMKYILAASGLKTDDAFFSSARGQRPKNLAHDVIERNNAYAIASITTESVIERIFSRSVLLNSEAIVEFVTQLVAVSEQELYPTAAGHQARVFSMQKLVEVADFNMDARPRVVWAGVWDILSKFFAKVGCHSNKSVAMFAIDSLKQLSLKFLEKEELRNFHFQTKFLWPFVAIVSSGPPPPLEIRELVIHVVTNIVKARAHNIRSGWKSVLAVFSVVATDDEPTLVSLAYDTLHSLVQQDQYFPMLSPFYVDAVHCLLSFASNAKDLVAIAAVDNVAELAAHLARGRVPLDDDCPIVPRTLWKPRRASSMGVESQTAPEQPQAYSYDTEFWYNLDGPENEDVVAAEQEAVKYLKLSGSGALGDSASKLARLEMRGSGGSEITGGSGIGGVLVEDEEGGWIRRFTECQAHFTHWWPLLTGLAALVGDDRLAVRTRALDILFGILRDYGPGFSASFWALVFRGVLLPLFDDVRHIQNPSPIAGGSGRTAAVARATKSAASKDGPDSDNPLDSEETTAEDVNESIQHHKDFEQRGIGSTLGSMTPTGEEWLKTTCMSALSSLVRLQNRYFSRLAFLLGDLLRLLENCILQDIEGLARIGVACLQLLLQEAGPRFTGEIWDQVTACVVRLFDSSTPLELLACRRYFLDYQAFSDSEDDGNESEGHLSPTNKLRLQLAASGSTGPSPTPGTPRRLYKTPYGDGILTHIRTEDGVASVSLNWGAILYCPSYLLGVTDQQLDALGEEHVPVPRKSDAQQRRRISSTDQDALIQRCLDQVPPGLDEDEYARQQVRIRNAKQATTVPKPAGATVKQGEKVSPPKPHRAPTLPFRSIKVVTECVVQLELIAVVNVLTESYLTVLSNDNLVSIITILENSVEFARKFNADRRLREALWRAGFMRFARRNKLPLLLRQETTASHQLLLLLLELLHDESSAGSSKPAVDRRRLASAKLMTLAQRMVSRVSKLDQDIHGLESSTVEVGTKSPPNGSECEDSEKELLREIATYSPLVVKLLESVMTFSDAEFLEHLSILYPLLVELMRCGSRDVRRALFPLFQSRIRVLLPGSIPQFAPETPTAPIVA